MEKICKQCGKIFKTGRSYQQTCSKVCSKKYASNRERINKYEIIGFLKTYHPNDIVEYRNWRRKNLELLEELNKKCHIKT